MNEESLFHLALAKPAAERAAFLEEACAGDGGLRQRVDVLLRAHENPDNLLDKPVQEPQSGLPTSTHPIVEPSADKPDATQAEAMAVNEHDLSFLSPPTKPGFLGRVGHYEVQQVVGKGGFGIVLKGFDERLHRVVAIKVLSPAYAANGPARKRFIREARAAAAVKNEHVVGIYDVQDEARPPYLVMELIDGISLQDKLDKVGSLGVKEILRIGMQMAEGLAAAHKQGLVHRDIKPANILLENGVERVKITDFGLARAVDDASVTQSGTVSGTPLYMSPEQAEGLAIDHRSDLFSLGTVLYAMCTGHPPFRASGTHAVLKRVIDAAPRPIREINNEIPDWLEAIIAKLHAKKPEDRFATARELAELLGQHLAHLQQPNLAPLPARVRQADVEPAAGTRPPFAWLVVLVLFMAVMMAFSLWAGTERGLNIGLLSGLAGSAALLCLLWVAMRLVLSGRRRWVVRAAIALLILFSALWFGPSVLRHVQNRAEIEFLPNPSMTSAIVVQNGVSVTDWMDVRNGHSVSLSPGKYQINGGTRPGFTMDGWEISRPGLFTDSGLRMPGDSFQFEVQRGERVTVRPLTREVPVARAGEPAKEDGWVQLFNRKNLDGWTTLLAPEVWRVKDGILVGGGDKGYLVSEREFENFHFRVEAKFIGKMDSGQWCRFKPGLNQAYEAQIGGDTGTLLRIDAGGPVLLYRNKDDSVPADTWFTQEVIADGNRLIVKLNGDTVVNAVDDKYRSGHLALQSFNKEGTVYFRKIEIKELPPTYKDDKERLQGRWVAEAVEVDRGKPVPEEMRSQFRMTFTGSTMHVTMPQPEEGTFHLDETTKPKQIDVIGADRKGRFGIYRFDGDRLVLCMGEDDQKDRPTEFTSKGGTRRMLGVFKRAAEPALAVAPFNAAKAKEHQDAWAKHLGVEPEITNSLGMKLRLIPPGEFLMGSGADEAKKLREEMTKASVFKFWIDMIDWEVPRHAVRLTQPFRMSAHEVTVDQFRQFVQAKDYKTEAERDGKGGQVPDPNTGLFKADPDANWRKPGPYENQDSFPVGQVSWNDAQEFCRWLSKKEGIEYRLPTEAEWEYACRAGSQGRYSFGDDPDDTAQRVVVSQATPLAVGSKKPNGFGLFDMEGNAWEWTGDRLHHGYENLPQVDPPGPKEGNLRVYRGGSFGTIPLMCRPSLRAADLPTARTMDTGFRVVLVGDLRAK